MQTNVRSASPKTHRTIPVLPARNSHRSTVKNRAGQARGSKNPASYQAGGAASTPQWQIQSCLANDETIALGANTYRRVDPAQQYLRPKYLSWTEAVGYLDQISKPYRHVITVNPFARLPFLPLWSQSQASQGLQVAQTPRRVRRDERQDPRSDFERDRQLRDKYRALLAEAAHDVRSPIASASQLISAVSDRARGLGNVTEAEIQLLTLANQRLAQANSWARGILTESRLERSSYVAIRKRFYPHQWQALMSPLLHSIATEHNVRLLWIGWERSLPKLYVDVNFLSRVILNLVTNAIQASSVGAQIGIRVSWASGLSKRLLIQVEDQGRGLSSELLREINSSDAEDDRQAGQAPYSTRKDRQLGIGLKSAKSLVAAMGGTISAQRQQTSGTQVRLSLPIDNLESLLSVYFASQPVSRNTRHSVALQNQEPRVRFSAYGIRIAPSVDGNFADRRFQQLLDSNEFVYRITKDRWLYFCLTENQEAGAMLKDARAEFVEAYGESAFRMINIAKSAWFSSSQVYGTGDHGLPSLLRNVCEQALASVGKLVPTVDNLQLEYGRIYSDTVAHCATQNHRPAAKAAFQEAEKEVPEALNELIQGWKKTQRKLNKAHRMPLAGTHSKGRKQEAVDAPNTL